MKKKPPNPVSKSFRGRLEPEGSGLKWTVIRVPVDVAKVWGTRGLLKVKVQLNGHEFRTSLFPTKSGQHFLMVNKKMQATANIRQGDVASVRLEPDTAPRVVVLSGDLQCFMKQDRALRRWFDALNYSARKEITDWVAEPKHVETRKRRAEHMAERLLETMEAERELPPLIQAALTANHKAREGWKRMAPGRRRRELLGIFYYRNPESRNRRLEKVVQAAADLMEKKELSEE